jgi:hypothetical protein
MSFRCLESSLKIPLKAGFKPALYSTLSLGKRRTDISSGIVLFNCNGFEEGPCVIT